MKDLKQCSIDPTPTQINFQEIITVIEINLELFKKKIKYPFRRMVKPFGIYIHDLDKSIFIDLRNGRWTETNKENTRYSMCSQVCWYTFKYEWGTGTLQVSGMFLDEKYPAPTSKYFVFQNMLSTGFLSTKSIRQTLRTLNFIWRKNGKYFIDLYDKTVLKMCIVHSTLRDSTTPNTYSKIKS
tara:strand:- start:1793 stop:2341 length:549 start_codon:yes stop_codon:yes gene_type:complete